MGSKKKVVGKGSEECGTKNSAERVARSGGWPNEREEGSGELSIQS